MSAPVDRRGILALFGAGTAAAAAGGATSAGMALGRLRPGFAGGTALRRGMVMRLVDEVDRAVPLAEQTPAALLRIVAAGDAGAVLAQQAAELRAIAALAIAYPPEVAAYRSFGPPMRRRLYAELLARESARLAPAAEPPPTPPASPGPGA